MALRTHSNLNIRNFRRKLANFDAVPQFALLGVISGALTGLVILAFRTLIEIPLRLLLPEDFENFEALPWELRLLLPVLGSMILILGLASLARHHVVVGVVHVLERLARHQGHMPVPNLIAQFLGGAVAMITGHSVGREGPAIHLGAAASSLLGQKLSLPNNSIRILAGCGAAAAISASFNTPIAGVIFSMEVILLEYTIAGFIPVILAAVTAALINQTVYGSDTAFQVPQVAMNTFYDIPFMVFEGALIGTLAAAYILMIKRLYLIAPAQLWQKLLIAGLVTGLTALLIPQVLGVGYDTVNQAMLGNLTIPLLLMIIAAKMLTSAVSVSMGIPAGLIGPTLFIGACAGGILGVAGATFAPETASSYAFYVMLGMGAMMGAVLQAPLAALMAIMELTHNPNIILPAMLVIVVANMTASQVFKMPSVFIMQMEMMGLEFRQNPLSMTLNRASVASIMNRSFVRVKQHINQSEAQALIQARHTWLLVDREGRPAFIIRTEDLTQFIAGHEDAEEINLADIPATRKDVTAVLLQATLAEALDTLNKSGVQALYVNRISAPMLDSVVGLVTREDIESYYQI